MVKPRFAVLTAIIFGAALFRLIPHPWNLTPVAAMALFGGARFSNKLHAAAMVFGAMILSDLVLAGYHSALPLVYASFGVILLMGFALKKNFSVARLAAFSLSGSLVFFLVTNFAAWLSLPMYPRSIEGLWACYAAGIPFFRNMLLGDLFFNAVLFGSFHALERSFPVLQRDALSAHA